MPRRVLECDWQVGDEAWRIVSAGGVSREMVQVALRLSATDLPANLDSYTAAQLGAVVAELLHARFAGLPHAGAVLDHALVEAQTRAIDGGIEVQRWFEPLEGGGQETACWVGELVKVVVRVATPMERNYLTVEVPLPAGLELIDTSLA